MGQKLLIVDDEPKVIAFMQPFLVGEGFEVLTTDNGPDALRIVNDVSLDLIVLDWMLPGMNGLDVCRAIRQKSKVGIIMVTARGDESDKVIGLELGADDYLAKPFGLRELAARIRSVIRRTAEASESTGTMEVGDLTISLDKYRVWKHGEEIFLTPTEFKILVTLAGNPGRVYSRLQLLKQTMGEEYFNYERTVDTHVSHLRQKLEDNPGQPRFVETVYGIGYRFGAQA